jgi:excisionase family DNA binding protein
MATDRILTTDEVAELMRVSYNTARKWIKLGRIPGRKIGRVWRVVESDLIAFVAGGVKPIAEQRPLRRLKASDLLGSCADLAFSSEDIAREHADEIERDERRPEAGA